jgi:hypothetical protein
MWWIPSSLTWCTLAIAYALTVKAMDFVIGFAVFAPFPILAVLCWVFWRAAKRDEAEGQSGANDAQSIPK